MSIKTCNTIKNLIKNHSYTTLVHLLESYSNGELNGLDYILGLSLNYKNLESFRYFIHRIDYIPYFLMRKLLREKHNIEFTEIILDRLEMLEELETDKVHKIYGQILASLLIFHTNIEGILERILNNHVFNFEEIIKNDNFRVNFILISLNNIFRVQNLKAVIDLTIPYYVKNNIPLEELLYVILYRYRHIKTQFVLKQLSSFKGLLTLNYNINLDSKDLQYHFDYDEEEDEEDEEYDVSTTSISNIKLGSLLMYFHMATNYFNRVKVDFIEDIEDMKKIKAFKEYYKIKDIK